MDDVNDADPVIDESYPSRQILELIGDKWTPIVLYVLGHRTKRYSDLQRQIPGISKKMLTQTLRGLEADGMLDRTVYAVVPPKVEYKLTALGRRFVEPIAALCEWGQEHRADLEIVRANRRKGSPPESK
ncbi:MAG: helix-turn-helix domain-containing protein [Singulisphaera sp.]